MYRTDNLLDNHQTSFSQHNRWRYCERKGSKANFEQTISRRNRNALRRNPLRSERLSEEQYQLLQLEREFNQALDTLAVLVLAELAH